jgi:hypothetical protein
LAAVNGEDSAPIAVGVRLPLAPDFNFFFISGWWWKFICSPSGGSLLFALRDNILVCWEATSMTVRNGCCCCGFNDDYNEYIFVVLVVVVGWEQVRVDLS